MNDIEEKARRHVSVRLMEIRQSLDRGRRKIERQKEIVKQLERDGRILALAKELLGHLEGLQQARHTESELLRSLIAKRKPV
jgi:flagellar biosynthesis/type III secretory pathway chaperone